MATFYNQATLTYNGNTATSNITVGEIVDTLSVAKIAISPTYSSGDTVSFIIHLKNTGITALNTLTLTDNLGSYTYNTLSLVPLTYVNGSIRYFINGTLQAAPIVTANNNLTISGINVPADSIVTIAYETTVNSYAPLSAEASITNTVSITGDGLAATITADETINPDTSLLLSISKSMNPTTVSENGQLTYTFTIQNTSNTPAVAADNVSVTDTFDPALNNISVTFNNTAWSQTTNYEYNEETGLFTTIPGQLTVPSATYTQNTTTGEWIVTPGTSILTVTGTI